jgi:hypothetical protein
LWWIQSALVYRTFMTLQHFIGINYLSYVCNIFKSCTIFQCYMSLDCFCVETLSIATLTSPPRWNSGYVHNNLPRLCHHHTPPSHSFSATVPTTPLTPPLTALLRLFPRSAPCATSDMYPYRLCVLLSTFHSRSALLRGKRGVRSWRGFIFEE